jgi:lipopolysaccharide/colanic/teichoic acid biosynthesis glycosyltransferase
MQEPLKRAIDIVLAAALLLLLSPILFAIAVAIRLGLGRPVLFRQPRAGRLGQPFTILKFRTMSECRDATGAALPDVERLTRIGKFLRQTSLDELPELVNVLRGDMSLVGPRPLLMEYLPLYSAEQARRHEVRPGITGWTQVNGRNALTWNEKFNLDTWYVDHRSTRLDLKILARTVVKVVTREGISAPGTATMPPFQGD